MTLFAEIKAEHVEIAVIFLSKVIPKKKVHAVPFIENSFLMHLIGICLN